MSYDREEWRRPWRGEDTPAPTASAAEPSSPPPSTSAPSEPAWAQPASESTQQIPFTTEPIARYPQPPPAAWDESSAGPGSPAGSVRPPDTTGTVDAPARSGRARSGLFALLAGLLGAVIGTVATLGLLLPRLDADTDAGSGPVAAPTIEIDGDPNQVVPAVAQAVTPSVVTIELRGGTDLPVESQDGVGSGVIYRSDGYILTNHHVVRDASSVRVRLSSGDILEGEVIGSDALNDLAVVRVDRDDLPAVNVRDTSVEPLLVGEQVVAIGSPFGLQASVTSGIISALNRDLRVEETDEGAGVFSIPNVIQTDAAINPGNSGGALVDARGRLLGINTAILTRTGASQGVGFAVPVEQAITSADQLIEQGFVEHPLLGVSGLDVSPEVAEEFGLEAPRGALVDSVQEGTGADEAGMRPGDIIVSVDGEPLATMSELVAEVRRRQPGETLELGVVRDGEELTIEVTLGERPR
ncbi:MAG TPA: trypsin-like peptidase domain-containing protein [Egicoccus sp.]|nr:trypsin-like peptidase domain-containing protein [Egicoccus sp.]HSK23441.1 trypsin-like peptidase domain-containing protein [Egicoccus sp.]